MLKNDKVAGSDEVPAEALKVDMTSTVNILHHLFKKIRDQTSGKRIPKSGNMRECYNYRGILLLSIPGKVFSRILLDKMKTAVDAKLRDQQAKFRKDRSCIDQICTL